MGVCVRGSARRARATLRGSESNFGGTGSHGLSLESRAALEGLSRLYSWSGILWLRGHRRRSSRRGVPRLTDTRLHQLTDSWPRGGNKEGGGRSSVCQSGCNSCPLGFRQDAPPLAGIARPLHESGGGQRAGAHLFSAQRPFLRFLLAGCVP